MRTPAGVIGHRDRAGPGPGCHRREGDTDGAYGAWRYARSAIIGLGKVPSRGNTRDLEHLAARSRQSDRLGSTGRPHALVGEAKIRRSEGDANATGKGNLHGDCVQAVPGWKADLKSPCSYRKV